MFAGVRFPDDVISADTVLGEVSACVCQLTAAAPPSVTLATDTCWLWSQIQYTLLSYREMATPYTVHSKYNESCFHAVLPSDCYNSYRKSMRKSVLLGNKIPLVVRTPWQSCCWLSARHVTCPSVQPSPLSPLSHDGHNGQECC